ncbi:MAG: SUMF1/EgtB/PvdO family nonheme iron enzyme [Gammaproteobacteria bacterium]|nr:SUMF1/EgtB/PvdO family nonheme iron enzyme [Gammaproteobacteria bacterium]
MRRYLLGAAGFDYVHIITEEKVTPVRINTTMLDELRNRIDANGRFLSGIPALTTCCDRLKDGTQGPEMIRLPKGCYTMGNPETEAGRSKRETQRRECVESIVIGKHEVTFDEYDTFAKATGRTLPADKSWGRGQHPASTCLGMMQLLMPSG